MGATVSTFALSTQNVTSSHLCGLIQTRKGKLNVQGGIVSWDLILSLRVYWLQISKGETQMFKLSLHPAPLGRPYKCFLKGKANGHPKSVSREGLTSGYSLRPCSERPGQCLTSLNVKEPNKSSIFNGFWSVCFSEFKPLDVYKDVNFIKAEYDFLFTPDSEACQRVCTLEPFCQFFTFDKSQ